MLSPITLEERGIVKRVGGCSHCVKLPRYVADRQAEAAFQTLKEAGIRDIQVDVEWYPSGSDPHIGPGSGITLHAVTSANAMLGADALGEKGKPAEEVGGEAASKLLEELDTGMVLDRHMGDMIIPYLAVADGRSRVTVSQLTLHTMTNIKVTEMISGVSFRVEGEIGRPGSVEVEGIGLVTPYSA